MGKRILVVDDDSQDLDAISKVLKKKKYEVNTFENGALAFDFLSKNKCDLILIDILMDTLSGYDLMRLLKEKIKKGTKIAYISIVPKQEVDLRGVDAFIQKPFSPQTLLTCVENLIRK